MSNIGGWSKNIPHFKRYLSGIKLPKNKSQTANPSAYGRTIFKFKFSKSQTNNYLFSQLTE